MRALLGRIRAFRRPRPKVSVLLSSYNYEKFIEQSIQSVLAQTYRPIELIIVDDGSSDNSRAVIESACAKSPIPVKLIFKKNAGQASAINAAFEASTGDVIALLDSDDYWYPEKLEELVSFIERCSDGGVYQHPLDTPYGRKRNSVMSADVFALWKQWGKGLLNVPDDHTALCFSPFLPTSGLAFRRSVLEKILPIPAALSTCPDAFLTRTAICQGPLYSIPQTLGFWRDHGDNMTYRSDFSFQEFWLPVILPALNSYYRNAGINFQLTYEPELRARLCLTRIFGPGKGPVDGIELAGAIRQMCEVSGWAEYRLEFEARSLDEREIRFDTAIDGQRRREILARCGPAEWTRVVTDHCWPLENETAEAWISPSSLVYLRNIRLRRLVSNPNLRKR